MSKHTKVVVIERTLQIIQFCADKNEPTGVTEIANSLRIPKANVFRILRTLEEHDFVIQDPKTEHYSLGLGILRLSEKVDLESTLLSLSRPYLEELVREVDETVNLGVIRNAKVYLPLSISPNPDSRLIIRLGPIAELHSSSLGKALLAEKSDEVVATLLGDEPFPTYTPNTLTTFDDFLKDLEIVRATGVSFDDEETEEGLLCIGAPIFDWSSTIAALSVSAPKSRLKGKRVENTKKLILATSAKITEILRGN